LKLKYNCHAFAWILDPLLTYQVWQVWLKNPYHKKFWEDYSYIEVPTPSSSSKVWFGGPCYGYSPLTDGYGDLCDHSAIATSTPNYYISKWGSFPRFRHHINDCPYTTTDLHFFERFIITGPNVVPCSGNVTYTLPSSVTSVNWSVHSDIQIVSGQNTPTLTVKRNSSGVQQNVLLSVTCSYDGKTFNLSKSLDISVPSVTSIEYSPSYITTNTQVLFYANPNMPSNQGKYQWTISPSSGVYESVYGNSNSITFTYPGSYTIGVRTYSDTWYGHPCTIYSASYKYVFVNVN